MLAGLDVVRLNFSHGCLSEHSHRIGLIRHLNRIHHRHIRILGDLEGHRIRIGTFRGGRSLQLKNGEIFTLFRGTSPSGCRGVSLDYEGPFEQIPKGKIIYIDDGTIALKVVKASRDRIKTKVITAGLLKENKGVNIPGVRLQFSEITAKDQEDIEFAVKNKLDYLAQSFVRNAADVIEVKGKLKSRLPKCRIIAKIENQQGINNIDKIIDVSDGIMIARGDMGVCVPVYKIPIIQKEIIRKCNNKKRFVITATQMLERMVESRIPTRAEVTDVANAVLDGTDFVMLSAETAAGRYPVQAVDMMNKILAYTEKARHRIRLHYV